MRVYRTAEKRDKLMKKEPRIVLGIDETSYVDGRELVYNALKGYGEAGTSPTLLLLALTALLEKEIKIPLSPHYNKSSRRYASFFYTLQKNEFIKAYQREPSLEEKFGYRCVKDSLLDLAPRWQMVNKELQKFTEEMYVNLEEVPNYTNLNKERFQGILSGKLFASNNEMDELERFFGKKIIKRWNFYNLPRSLLNPCLEGWKRYENTRKLVEKYKLEDKVGKKFKFRCMSVEELIKESVISFHYTIAFLLAPKSKEEILLSLKERKSIEKNLKILSLYGVIRKEGDKVELPYLYIWKMARDRIAKHIEWMKKYVEIMKMEKVNIRETSEKFKIPAGTICYWINREHAPKPIPTKLAEDILLTTGTLSINEVEEFRKFGLLR